MEQNRVSHLATRNQADWKSRALVHLATEPMTATGLGIHLERDGYAIDLITLGRWLNEQVAAGVVMKSGRMYSLSPDGPEAA